LHCLTSNSCGLREAWKSYPRADSILSDTEVRSKSLKAFSSSFHTIKSSNGSISLNINTATNAFYRFLPMTVGKQVLTTYVQGKDEVGKDRDKEDVAGRMKREERVMWAW
jgi:hypothetical protein